MPQEHQSALDLGELEQLRALLPEYMAQRGCVVGQSGRKKICCINPAHPDSTPSMSYHPASKKLHCFGCGVNYDLFDVIGMDYPSCETFLQRVQKAREVFGIERTRAVCTVSRGADKPSISTAAVPPTAPPAQNYTDYIRKAVERCGIGGAYFQKRGISMELCTKYSLFEDEGRAWMPIFDEGQCRCYCARATEDHTQPKFKNSPGAGWLFNADLLRTQSNAPLVVTESILDALSAEQCGMQAVALCGAGNVRRLLELCAQHPSATSTRLFIAAGDADAAGQHMNEALCEGLTAMGLGCVSMQLPDGCKDINDALLQAPALLQEAFTAAVEGQFVAYGQTSGSAALAELLAARTQGRAHRPIPTGFAHLDRLLDGGLYPGLYIIGAATAVGKTSFVLQMADQIAMTGQDVLFISLEMSRGELVAKSLSRISAGQGTGFTMRQALRPVSAGGVPAKELSLAAGVYEKWAGSIFFREGVSGCDVAELVRLAREHQRLRGRAPVVVVDYLQILRPADPRAGDKQNVDRAVVELKRLSRDLNTPVLAVSSFNREGYRGAVSMEAFKESGAVEYSADVLFGLQPRGAGSVGFDPQAAKQNAVRSLELVLLKNRAGVGYGKLALRYDARFAAFREIERGKI